VHEAFDRFIDEFLKKWEPVIRAAREGRAPKGKVKGQIPTLAACFQAMRDWPDVEPGEIGCPALLLTGTRNRSALGWVEANRDLLDASGMRVKVIAGLTHDQEFTQVDRVFPAVSSFLLRGRVYRDRKTFEVSPVGYVRREGGKTTLDILDLYVPTLKQMEHLSQAQVLCHTMGRLDTGQLPAQVVRGDLRHRDVILGT
jgi:hypothetical protein